MTSRLFSSQPSNKQKGSGKLPVDPRSIPNTVFDEAISVKPLDETSSGEDDSTHLLPPPKEIPFEVGPHTVESFDQLALMILSRLNAFKKYYENQIQTDTQNDPVKRRELEELKARYMDVEDELLTLSRWISANLEQQNNPEMRGLLYRLYKIARELPVDSESEAVPEDYFKEFGDVQDVNFGESVYGARQLELRELPPDPKGLHEKNVLRQEMEAAVPKIQTCIMCREKIKSVDPFNVGFLHHYLTDTGLIVSKKISGNCSKHQRKIAKTIKRSRHLGLFTYKKGVFEIRNPFEDFDELQEVEEQGDAETVSGLVRGLDHILSTPTKSGRAQKPLTKPKTSASSVL